MRIEMRVREESEKDMREMRVREMTEREDCVFERKIS